MPLGIHKKLKEELENGKKKRVCMRDRNLIW